MQKLEETEKQTSSIGSLNGLMSKTLGEDAYCRAKTAATVVARVSEKAKYRHLCVWLEGIRVATDRFR